MQKKTLNPKQRRFVAEYLKDQNGTQSAIRAGYSKNTAESIASRLLRNVNVRAEVELKLQKVENGAIATREERQRFWSDTMRKDSVEYQHRIRTSELLGKSQGDFIEKVEHSVTEDLRDLIMASTKKVNATV